MAKQCRNTRVPDIHPVELASGRLGNSSPAAALGMPGAVTLTMLAPNTDCHLIQLSVMSRKRLWGRAAGAPWAGAGWAAAAGAPGAAPLPPRPPRRAAPRPPSRPGPAAARHVMRTLSEAITQPQADGKHSRGSLTCAAPWVFHCRRRRRRRHSMHLVPWP